MRYQGEMTLFTINSTDYIGTLSDCEIEIEDSTIESSGIALLYEHEQVGGSSMKAKATIKKDHGSGSNDFSCNLDCTAIAIGGVSQLTKLKTGKVTLSTTTKDERGKSERWHKPKIVKKKIEASFSLMCDTVSEDVAILVANTTVANKNVVSTITLDGTAYAFPALLKRAGLKISDADLQMLDVVLSGRSFNSTPLTNFPTTPTGTTTIAEKALNTVAALTFDFRSAALGVWVSGSLIITGLELEVPEEGVITASYSFESYGTVTVARGA